MSEAASSAPITPFERWQRAYDDLEALGFRASQRAIEDVAWDFLQATCETWPGDQTRLSLVEDMINERLLPYQATVREIPRFSGFFMQNPPA